MPTDTTRGAKVQGLLRPAPVLVGYAVVMVLSVVANGPILGISVATLLLVIIDKVVLRFRLSTVDSSSAVRSNTIVTDVPTLRLWKLGVVFSSIQVTQAIVGWLGTELERLVLGSTPSPSTGDDLLEYLSAAMEDDWFFVQMLLVLAVSMFVGGCVASALSMKEHESKYAYAALGACMVIVGNLLVFGVLPAALGSDASNLLRDVSVHNLSLHLLADVLLALAGAAVFPVHLLRATRPTPEDDSRLSAFRAAADRVPDSRRKALQKSTPRKESTRQRKTRLREERRRQANARMMTSPACVPETSLTTPTSTVTPQASADPPPVAQSASEVAPAVSPVNRVWRALGALSVIVTLYGGLLTMAPRLSVTMAPSLDSSDPLATPFVTTNEGLIPVYNLTFVGDARNLDPIPDGAPATISQAEIYLREDPIPVLRPTEKATTRFPSLSLQLGEQDHRLTRFQLEVTVQYYVFGVPFNLEKKFTFITVKDRSGQSVWMPGRYVD